VTGRNGIKLFISGTCIYYTYTGRKNITTSILKVMQRFSNCSKKFYPETNRNNLTWTRNVREPAIKSQPTSPLEICADSNTREQQQQQQ
jgi:hypothetical protein